jgi:hypothetical protein
VTIRNIENNLEKNIVQAEPKGVLQYCDRILVEVDLKKGLPEAINLILDNWSYLQKVDSEQLCFKFKVTMNTDTLLRISPKIPQNPIQQNPMSNGISPRREDKPRSKALKQIKRKLNQIRDLPPGQKFPFPASPRHSIL